jgi:hypothetical protein
MVGLPTNAGIEARDVALVGIAGERCWYLPALILTIFPILLSISGLAAAQDNPTGFVDIVRRADAAREAGEGATAIQLYEEAERVNPKWPDGWFFLGSPAMH